MACVFVCVCRGRGVAGESNAHAMSLDTWRTCLLNQKVRFVTGEVGDADSAHPPGGLALLAVWGVGGVAGGPLSGSWRYAHLWRGPFLRVGGGRWPKPSQWMPSCSWAPCPPDSPGRVGVCGLIDTFFFLPIICEACVESERGGGNAPHVRGQPTPR